MIINKLFNALLKVPADKILPTLAVIIAVIAVIIAIATGNVAEAKEIIDKPMVMASGV